MATAPRIAIRPYKTLSGLPFPMESFPEAATQTFKQGAVVRVSQAADSTQGYLVECGTDPLIIMGIASRDGQSGGSNGTYSQSVYLATPDMLFVGNLDISASEGTGTTAATDRGKQYGLYKSTATNTPWYVDKSDAANGRVVVWNFYDGAVDGVNMAVGDTLGWVIFGFDPNRFQGLKTS